MEQVPAPVSLGTGVLACEQAAFIPLREAMARHRQRPLLRHKIKNLHATFI